jgi:radical SAM protein with 4Fe4S-binding SPASM domain
MDSKYMLVSPHVKIRWTETVEEEIIEAVHKVTGKVFKLNKKTLNLLQLCDGTRTCQELVAEFKKSYPQTKPGDILKAIKTLSGKGLSVERDSVSQSSSRISYARLESPLRLVTWEITNTCNLRCLHCYNDAGPHRKQFFSLGEIECIVGKLDRMNVGRISLSGGEPLLHPHFLDLITILRERGIPWSLFSNAVLIDEKMAKNLVDYGIRKVTTSLDGSTAKSHDFLRGVKGSFQKTVNAIKILKEYNVPIEARCALHKKNVREIPAVLAFLNSLGIDTYMIAAITKARPQKESNNPTNEITITNNDFIDALPEIVRAEYEIFGKSRLVPDFNPDRKNCGGGTSSFMIKPDGRMVPCPFSDPAFFTFGNALTDDIEKAWNTAEILKKMRSFDFRSIKKCSTCKYQFYCDGGCPIKKYERYHDAFALDPLTCTTMETLHPYVDALDVD